MYGKLLVLCDERPTINNQGQRIDENGEPLIEMNGRFYNLERKSVEVDIDKKVISGFQLLDQNTLQDIVYVDWETIYPTDIELLKQMEMLFRNDKELTLQEKSKIRKVKSLIEKVYMEKLMLIDRLGYKPSNDYESQALNDFMTLFSETTEHKGVVAVLPAFLPNDFRKINDTRKKLMDIWHYNQSTEAEITGKEPIRLAEPIVYSNFGELREKAQDELANTNIEPYSFKEKKSNTGDVVPGGRD